MERTKENKYIKQIFASVVIVALMAATTFALVFAGSGRADVAASGNEITAMSGTTGTPCVAWFTNDPNADEFFIDTADELAGLAQITNNTITAQRFSFLGKTITLTADIDLNPYGKGTDFDSGRGWEPIGFGFPFSGVFDGNNHTISGLFIDDISEMFVVDNFGLFGRVSGGTIKNLSVVGSVSARIGGSGGVVGALLVSTGDDPQMAKVHNVSFFGNVTNLSSNAGGIAGTIFDSVVSNSYVKGNISSIAENARAGGIVGLSVGGRIKRSNFEGEVSAFATAGGIAGEVQSFDRVAMIYSSNAEGTIKVSQNNVGGIVGKLSNGGGTIRYSGFKGSVQAGGLFAGGIAGRVASSSEIIASGASGTVAALHGAAGVAGYLVEGSIVVESFHFNEENIVSATDKEGLQIPEGNVFNGLPQGLKNAEQIEWLGHPIIVWYNGQTDKPIYAGSYHVEIGIKISTQMSEVSVRVPLGYFTIAKRLPRKADISFSIPTNIIYNSSPQGIFEVIGESWLGEITVLFNGSQALPTLQGVYTVTAHIAQTENTLETILLLGELVILPPQSPTGLEWWHILALVLGSIGVAVAICVIEFVVYKKRKLVASNASKTSTIESNASGQESIDANIYGDGNHEAGGYTNDNGHHPFFEDLTKREIEVARLILKGKNQKEIMDELVITEHTVKKHIRSILEKSDCSNQKEFIIKCNTNSILIM